ncbi:Phytosulfokines 5 [Hordeum vulgare]|nr:Phytosulfokines 5 [Hordeum vulgare]
MAAARVAAQEAAIRAHISKKQQRRNTCALAREQNRAVHEMARLPLKVEKEVGDGEDSSGDEHIQLDPYCFFDQYFREKDDKDSEKRKGSHR